jgi:Arc/MetJ-type ribon-helix-helix transcriptional regulator
MNMGTPITVTIEPYLRLYAERQVELGRAPSISAVINSALAAHSANRDRGLAMLRARAASADEATIARVERMMAHIDAQAAALGLERPEAT